MSMMKKVKSVQGRNENSSFLVNSRLKNNPQSQLINIIKKGKDSNDKLTNKASFLKVKRDKKPTPFLLYQTSLKAERTPNILHPIIMSNNLERRSNSVLKK